MPVQGAGEDVRIAGARWTTHDPGVIGLLAEPFLRAYRDDPSFIAFAQKIGVMPK